MAWLKGNGIEAVLSLVAVGLVIASLVHVIGSAREDNGAFESRLHAYNQFMQVASLFKTKESCQATLADISKVNSDGVSVHLQNSTPGRVRVNIDIGELHRVVPLDVHDGNCILDIGEAQFELAAGVLDGPSCSAPWREGYAFLCPAGKMLIRNPIPRPQFFCCPLNI